MAALLLGRYGWKLSRDEEGNRTYNIAWKIASSTTDGPLTVAFCAGLPAVGSTWNFGSDSDPWAFCRPEFTCEPIGTDEDESTLYWKFTQTFATSKFRENERCQNTQIDNPLDEPPRISGSFVKYTKRADVDKDGNPLQYSNKEPITGPLAEFDANRPSVSISLNRLTLPITTFSSFYDCVNDATLWGIPKRCVKLSSCSWSRLMYGTCTFYYQLDYTFDINYQTFDPKVINQGFKYLKDGGNPNVPSHWTLLIDKNTGNVVGPNLLTADGKLVTNGVPTTKTLKVYPEVNMLTLGIPSSL